MKDEYNNPITMITQERFVRSVPNHGQIDRVFNDQAFYEYRLLTENFTDCLSPIIFDVEQAHRFAQNNNLKMVTSVERLLYFKRNK